MNFVPAADAAPQSLLSRLDTGSATLTFRPVKPLKIENTYLFERLRATENEYLFALSQAPAGHSHRERYFQQPHCAQQVELAVHSAAFVAA